MLEVKKAAAGSGKTFLLTQEYLKLILGYRGYEKRPQLYYNKRTANKQLEAHSKILAITFTNKATEEMKQRIVNELHIISSGQKSPHLETLCKFYNVKAEVIMKACKKALSELLFDYTRFNISTIDSFFQIILRTFTREANIGAEYGVELEEDSVIDLSTIDLIHSLRRNEDKNRKKLHQWLKQYIISKIDHSQNWNIFLKGNSKFNSNESLFSIAKEIGKEEFKSHKKEFMKFISSNNSISNFKKALDDKIKECQDIKIKNCINFYETLTSAIDEKGITKNHVITNYAKKIVEGNLNGTLKYGDFEIKESFIKRAEEPQNLLNARYSFDSQTLNLIKEYISNIIEVDKEETIYGLMGKNLFALGLLGDISKNLQKYRDENDIILLSDTNEYLKRIIGDDDTPFIYERVGLRLKHFLIDEFQDTSKLQMENIDPLLKESLSHDYYNLIIGDEKQSIYRFRNADPSLLQTKIFKDYSEDIPKRCSNVQRSTNWRSEENVIKFNNTLFLNLVEIISNEIDTEAVHNTYNNVVQDFVEDKEKKKFKGNGYIDISFIDSSDKEKDENDIEKWKIEAIKSTLKVIHGIIERGYKQSDIAILVASNQEGTNIINAILNDNESNSNTRLNVISDESLVLSNSPSVNLIINLLKYIDCSNSDLYGNEEKQKNVFKILQAFNKLISVNVMDYSDALKEALRNDSEVISEEMIKKMTNSINHKSQSLYTTVESLISNFIPKESLANESPYIFALQDAILDYCNHYTPTIHEFLKWWKNNEKSISITSPANIDAIRVMTIHKSKGLEFPCVIIPFASWDINNIRGLLWFEIPEELSKRFSCKLPPIIPFSPNKKIKETPFGSKYDKYLTDSIIDNLNKTYVALTRAIKELYIFSPQTDISKNGTDFDSYLNKSLHLKNEDFPEDTIDFDKCWEDENHTHFVYGKPFDMNEQDEDEEKNEKEKKEKEEEDKKNKTVIISDYYIPQKNDDKTLFKIRDIDDKETPAEEGTSYHDIMSFIMYSDDLDFALDKGVAKNIIKKEEKEKYRKRISEWINNPKTKIWFDKKYQIITERQMLYNNQILRADRIVIDRETNTACVIDYKFGKIHAPYYKNKVMEYMEVVKAAGYNDVKGFIWYPFEDAIEEIE